MVMFLFRIYHKYPCNCTQYHIKHKNIAKYLNLFLKEPNFDFIFNNQFLIVCVFKKLSFLL